MCERRWVVGAQRFRSGGILALLPCGGSHAPLSPLLALCATCFANTAALSRGCVAFKLLVVTGLRP